MISEEARAFERANIDRLVKSPEYLKRRDALAEVIVRHMNADQPAQPGARMAITDEMVKRLRKQFDVFHVDDGGLRKRLDFVLNGNAPDAVVITCEMLVQAQRAVIGQPGNISELSAVDADRIYRAMHAARPESAQ